MPLRAFIVEDNPLIRQNLIETLQEIAAAPIVGYAESEDEAVRWMTANPTAWDVVILDLFLKQGNGLGVLGKCSDRASDQTVVIFSNYATDAMRERCMQLGADAVFDKSNEIESLIGFFSSADPSHQAQQPLQIG